MRTHCFLAAICLAFATPAAFAAPVAPALPAQQQVDISLNGGLLHAYVFKPEGAGPFPLAIAIHDCGGLQGRSEVRSHYRDWAAQLVKAGYAVMLPDSYGSRDLGPQCRVTGAPARALQDRIADIAASRQWAAGQPWVQRKRISAIGWGEGADALLSAIRVQRTGRPELHTAIAFYPDCKRPLLLSWSAAVPTLVLTGADDDVSPASACKQMVDDAKGRSAFVRLVTYPGAPHGFDREGVALEAVAGRNDADLPASGHIGSNAKARADAQKRVVRWLGR